MQDAKALSIQLPIYGLQIKGRQIPKVSKGRQSFLYDIPCQSNSPKGYLVMGCTNIG